MKKKINDLTIVYQEYVPFNLLEDDNGAHVPTFKIFTTKNNDSIVIICQWVDGLSKQLNDMEEIFYIDGVNDKNCKQAETIILDVYSKLNKAFNDNPNQNFNMNSIVEKIYDGYEIKSVVLKSTHPEKYPDLTIECKVIPNDKIGEYLDTIPEERKFYAHKTGSVSARVGNVGEKIITSLKTIVELKKKMLKEKRNNYVNMI